MEARGYFNNEIKPVICDEIRKSSKNIYLAVAWFNDLEIFEVLKERVVNGVDVNIIMTNDDTNNILPFREISDLGAKVFKLVKENTLLHHKFCVIDEHTLITGSYNWTWAANCKNLENIVILENNIKLNHSFIQCFNNILDEEFKYIEETIDILGYMQEEIENLKTNIRKYKEVPESVMQGIEKIKSQNLMIEKPLNSLLSLESTKNITTPLVFKKTMQERIEWWTSLDIIWKYYFNEKVFKRGKVTDQPDDEGIENLLLMTSVNCQSYRFVLRANGSQTSYEISNLNGIKELILLNSLDCSNNNLSKLDAISGHKNLTKLICNNNKLQSLESIVLLKNLTHLECSNNPFTSLKGIENLTALNYLKVDSRFKEFSKDKERIDFLGLIEVGQEGNFIEYRK